VRPPHKFHVGQTVELIGMQRSLGPPLGGFEIMRLMPTENGRHQYRIRSLLDGHARMANESELEGQ
jgi:hypothetical protein